MASFPSSSNVLQSKSPLHIFPFFPLICHNCPLSTYTSSSSSHATYTTNNNQKGVLTNKFKRVSTQTNSTLLFHPINPSTVLLLSYLFPKLKLGVVVGFDWN
ncbi:hypothetical protein Droror1_Dr00016951 [Drosera rotundifolia]